MFKKRKRKASAGHSETAAQRKEGVIKFLATLNIPCDPDHPALPELSELKMRSAQDIALYIIAAASLYVVWQTPEQHEPRITWLKHHKLWNRIDPGQREALERGNFTDDEIEQIGGYFEVINMMLWCINQVPHIFMPTEIVDMYDMGARVVKILNNPKRFIKSARSRPASDILDMLDLVYRMHCTVAEALIAKTPIPGDLSLFVLFHRHGALAWITGYGKVMDGKGGE